MSDTHLRAVTKPFADLCERYCSKADLVIHLGDMVSPLILDFLSRYRLEAVAGNMDGPVIHGQLPVKKTVRLGGYRLGLIHGWGSGERLRDHLRREFTDVDAVLFGHTHQGLCRQENGTLWFNPGSVTLARGHSPCSIGLLHVGTALQGEILPVEEA